MIPAVDAKVLSLFDRRPGTTAIVVADERGVRSGRRWVMATHSLESAKETMAHDYQGAVLYQRGAQGWEVAS